MSTDELLVHAAALDDEVGDGVGQRQVALGHDADELVGPFRRGSAPRADVDEAHLGPLPPRLQNPGEEHRVHLRHVVAPEDEHVSRLQVVVVPHGLVHPEAGEEPGHRAGHAEAGVGFHVVRAHPGAEPLAGHVAVRERPLPGAVDGDGRRSVGLERLFELRGHQPEGFIPSGFLEFSAAANERRRQTVFAVEDGGQAVALDAKQAAVHRAQFVSRHRLHLAVLDAHHDSAADPAKTARRFRPSQSRVKARSNGDALRPAGAGEQIQGKQPQLAGQPASQAGLPCGGEKFATIQWAHETNSSGPGEVVIHPGT